MLFNRNGVFVLCSTDLGIVLGFEIGRFDAEIDVLSRLKTSNFLVYRGT